MMSRRFFRHSFVLCIATALGLPAATLVGQPPAPERPNAETSADESSLRTRIDEADGRDEEGVEYLTRGPLHEAFADPFARDPKPSPIVNAEPPKPLNEMPPEYRPEGDNVQWIPGYWAWDDEREDFLWISGVWRDVPPQRRWVPGYWENASDGYRWISGFWNETKSREVAYLPPPPESVDEGPSSPAPGESYFYVPGTWIYQDINYQWQPGHWAQAQPGWVWVPSQYYWTPRGCVYRDGYWDYDFADRGIVFTPVYYSQRIYSQPNYVYRPRYAVDTTAALLVNLFLRTNYNRYYFGDYYGNRYANSYHPWVNYSQRRNHYDPLYAYYSVAGNARNARTLDWVNRRYDYFLKNDGYRPPRTVAAQREFLKTNLHAGADLDPGILRSAAVAESLSSLVNDRDSGIKLQRIDQSQIESFREAATSSSSDLVNRRRQFEGVSSTRANADSDVRGDDANDLANAARDASENLELPEAPAAERMGRVNQVGVAAQRDAKELSEQSRRERDQRVGEAVGRNDSIADRARERAGNTANPMRQETTERDNPADGNYKERMEQLRNRAETLGADVADRSRENIEGNANRTAEQLRDLRRGAAEQGATSDNAARTIDSATGAFDRRSLGMSDEPGGIRQDGRARPPRSSDWPTREPRTNLGGNLPERPNRGDFGGGQRESTVPNLGGALNGSGAVPANRAGTPDATQGIRGAGNPGPNMNLGNPGRSTGNAVGGALGGVGNQLKGGGNGNQGGGKKTGKK